MLYFRPPPPKLPTVAPAPKDPITEPNYKSLVDLLRDSRTHDEYRVKLLQNALLHRSVTSEQARDILKEVDFNQNKGVIATILWRATRDRENFGPVVLDSLDDESRESVIAVISHSGFGNFNPIK